MIGEHSLAQSNIMVVDDNPDNLKVLEDMLRQEGYEVRSFPRGRLALTAAMRNPPDLILLDINMPEMNGYEVCEHLKSTEEVSGIPVIFLSALDETEDKVKAFRTGAVDYISKPFQFEEVQARVETHLKVHALQLALKQQNEHLGQRAGVLQLLASEEHASQKKVYSDGTAELRRFLKQTIDSVRARGQVDTRRVSLSAVISGLLLIPGWLFLLQAAPRWRTAAAENSR